MRDVPEDARKDLHLAVWMLAQSVIRQSGGSFEVHADRADRAYHQQLDRRWDDYGRDYRWAPIPVAGVVHP